VGRRLARRRASGWIWHGQRRPARGADSGRRCAGLRPAGGARGSGTSRHVQASSSAAGGGGTPDPQHTVSSLDGTRKPDKDILEHDWKPQVELRLLVLRDALEEQGFSEAEINVRVEEERKAAETEEAAAGEGRPRAQGEGYDARCNAFQAARTRRRPYDDYLCLSSYYSVLSIAFCCFVVHSCNCVRLLRANICQILF